MKVTYNGIEYECDSALRGGDYVLLFSSVSPTVSFFGVVNFEEFELEGGEWTYPYVTLSKNNWNTERAKGVVKITGTIGTQILKGTILTAQSQRYMTTVTVVISEKQNDVETEETEGEVLVDIVCLSNGSVGNIYGTLSFTFDNLEGVTKIENVGNVLGGSDNAPFTQTVNFVGVTSTNDILVAPKIETQTELEMIQDSQVLATSQGLNTVTFTAFDSKPSDDIKMNIKVLM